MKLEYRHLNWMQLIWDTSLTTKAKIVCAALATHMNANHHVAWPGMNRLAAMTGLSKRSVIRAVQEAEAAKWLAVEHPEKSADNKATNKYLPIFPPDVEAMMVTHSHPLVSESHRGSDTQSLGVVTESHSNQSIESVHRKTGGRMTRPAVEEVRQYCREKGYTFDPEAFIAFYESNGWKVGKNPMKSWHHACTTWQAREKDKPQNKPPPNAASHKKFDQPEKLTQAQKDRAKAELDRLQALQKARAS